MKWTSPVLHLAPTVAYMSTITQTEHRGQSRRPAPRARLVTGRLALVLLSSFGALTSFYLLLSVTPMYVVSAGAGTAAAGVVTGSLMLATVVAEFASARLMRRFGYRAVFAVGALLPGGPALALLAPHSVVTLLAVSVARGIGFGLNTVVTGALVATALPPERRGEGISLAGVVACVPAIVALPSGVWVAANLRYGLVITITAASALAPLAAAPGWPDRLIARRKPIPARRSRACWPAFGLAASCGHPWSSRPRRCRPAWSPRLGCSRRPWPRR